MSYAVASEWDEPSETNNYFIRHWRGQLALPVSYWVNCFGLLWALALSARVFLPMAESAGVSLQMLACLYLSFIACSYGLSLWGFVGVWRSAGFHEQRGGSSGWATVARIVVVFNVAGAIVQSQSSARTAVEYTRLAVGSDPMGAPAEMALDDTRSALVVEGPLSLGTANRFDALISEKKDVRRIVLRSAGGRTLEAQRMAETVARRKLDTEVKKECLSACTLVLLAGRERSATTNARIGFHQPSFPGLSAEDQRYATNHLRGLYEQAGVTSAFLDSAMSAPPQSMWYPSHDELINGNVLNTTNVVVSKANYQARRAQLSRYLKYSADQINAAGPARVDDITTRTGASASDRVLTLKFKISRPRETLNISAGKSAMLTAIRKDACADRYTRQAIRTGATVVFSYRDLNGREIFDLKVNECDSLDVS